MSCHTNSLALQPTHSAIARFSKHQFPQTSVPQMFRNVPWICENRVYSSSSSCRQAVIFFQVVSDPR